MANRSLLLLSLLFLASSAFAQSADLTINAVGNESAAGFSITFAMTNQGPDVARNAVLTIQVPPDITVDRIGFGAGDVIKSCDGTQRPIRCEVGDVHVGFPYHYGGLDVRIGPENGVYDFSFSLTSDTPDPNASNNSLPLRLQQVAETDFNVTVRSVTGRADPGAPGTFRGEVCNFAFGEPAPLARVEVIATNGTIQNVTMTPSATCVAESPSKTVCSAPELLFCNTVVATVAASDMRTGGETQLTVRVSSDLVERNPENDAASAAMQVYRWFTVTTTADSGPGSLRNAIHEANSACTPGPCRIVFEIPGPVPAEGWFTLTPGEPLPAIEAARVTLEGNRQTAFTGNTNPKGPEIAIDGRFARNGIRVLSPCEGGATGLALGNFDADQGLWISTGADCGDPFDTRIVADNHIGVDPTGEVAWPNLRGLRADYAVGLNVLRNVIRRNRYSGVWLWRGAATFRDNTIEDNGASGIFLGPEVFAADVSDNRMNRNREMGIAASRELYSLVMRRNEMRDNGGLGIDWGLDGVSPAVENEHTGPTNAPVLLSARYDASRNRTFVEMRLDSEPLGPRYNYGTIELFANRNADGDGEEFLVAERSGTFDGVFTVGVDGDYRGKWINATWTREHLPYFKSPGIDAQAHDPGFMVMSSELSNTVLVQ